MSSRLWYGLLPPVCGSASPLPSRPVRDFLQRISSSPATTPRFRAARDLGADGWTIDFFQIRFQDFLQHSLAEVQNDTSRPLTWGQSLTAGDSPRRPHVLQQEIVFARLFIHPKSAAGLPHESSLFLRTSTGPGSERLFWRDARRIRRPGGRDRTRSAWPNARRSRSGCTRHRGQSGPL